MSIPFESCPSFSGCNVASCPVDPMSELHGGPPPLGAEAVETPAAERVPAGVA